ncbi:MAG: response regulator [Deltaproteobacteria bacterium]|jgi:CheY-like chemotaxis protein|nr:response regulator [Deltaproteobacteria bacterium]
MNDKKRVLVVEDEVDVRTYISTLFQDQGYGILTAENGKEGFELAIKEKPDLITLDIAMPSQSGMRTFRMFKDSEELKSIPVIIITGMGEDVSSFIKRLKGFSSQPEGFMGKPIDEEKLIKMVSDLI